MKKLSVVIITYNEELQLGNCLDSVMDIADEILVVDSFSTDRTEVIAKEKGARFIQNKFEGHIEQKNFAKAQASCDFVLSLDADEELSVDLRASIKVAKNNFEADGYTMNRLNFYCGKPVRTCGWYPDTKLRLWNRNSGEWMGTNPHDKFELKEDSIIRHLNGDILHHTYPTARDLLSQVDKFATISAQHLKEKNIFYLMLKMVFSPPFKFIRNYFFKAGITEGAIGFTICFQQTKEVFLKYYRAIKLKT